MVKTINIGDKEVELNTAFAWTFIYKSQFGCDPTKVLIPAIQSAQNKGEEEAGFALLEGLGFVDTCKILWSMARLANKKIPELDKWIMSFGDDFNFMDVFADIIGDVINSCVASKNL